ncbi:hypothetical protein LG3211_1684 [Lysobacter gummosus]|nr:hypothetical protein LG3211_1684 [Lysobacter gummosus]
MDRGSELTHETAKRVKRVDAAANTGVRRRRWQDAGRRDRWREHAVNPAPRSAQGRLPALLRAPDAGVLRGNGLRSTHAL